VSERDTSTVSGIVLAGGRSSRMGTPKALLPLGGEPLIVHLVRRLRTLFDDVVVVCAPGQHLPELPARVVHDDIPYQGPVGGIYYGLSAAEREFGFVTSCDSAFLSVPLIRHIVSEPAEYDVVVPRWDDRYQPLVARYRKTVLAHLEAQLANGELRPVFLFDKVSTRVIEEDAIRRFDPDGASFFNMNTPADYVDADRRWRTAPRAGAEGVER
jgi:molybdopterin-guanine dinucleotide biosynthesis protein A